MKSMTKYFPRYKDCIALEDSQKISTKFNNFMRDDVLRLTTTQFAQQMSHFQFKANRKYREPNGDYIASSLDRAKWAKQERERVIKKINEPNHETSKQIILKTNAQLSKRIVEDLLPHYLKFRFRDNKKNIKQFEKKFIDFKSKELTFFNTELAQDSKSIKELTTLLQEKQNHETARYFVSSYNQLFLNSKLAILKVSNNIKYCDYMLYSKSMTPKNRSICKDGISEIKSEIKKINTFSEDLLAITHFDEWAGQTLRIQSSFVRDYMDRILDWNSKGDSRWELVEPSVTP